MQAPDAHIADLTYSVAVPGNGRLAIVEIEALMLRAGEMTALAGPSGSGKSTLLYLLSGLLVPDRGSVRWGETELTGLPEGARDAWRRRHAGFVFQSFNLIEELSPLDNVLAPSWFGGRATSGIRERAASLLERFSVPVGRTRAALLSRGEQQRVAIARSLLFDPPILFADEPTASLDQKSGATVIEALRQIADDGRTVLVATHDPALLAKVDRVIRLEGGRLHIERQSEAA